MLETLLFGPIVLTFAWWPWNRQERIAPTMDSSLGEIHRAEGDPHSEAQACTFLEEVKRKSEAADEEVRVALAKNDEDFQAKFGEHRQRKERLVEFARTHRLDVAMIELWEEVKFYPEYAKSERWERLNKLGVTSCTGSRESTNGSDVRTVSFILADIPFELVKTESVSFDGDGAFADFGLYENGVLVFGVNTSIGGEFDETYCCFDIFAFKKGGHWATLLLDVRTRRELDEGNRRSALDNFGVDKIEGNFLE